MTAEQQLQAIIQNFTEEAKHIFRTAYCNAIAFNIGMGETKATTLGIAAGLAAVKGFGKAANKAMPAINEHVAQQMAQLVDDDEENIEIVPATAIGRNGALATN